MFICRTDWLVVETDKGKLRGFFFDHVYQFRGVKYADAERFQQPHPVEPWEGIKDAQDYGYNAPLSVYPPRKPSGELRTPHRYWPENEHCQYLNIFTGSLDRNAGRAVMVWLHGGGYSSGSGNPNHPLIPEWKPCAENEITTMVFDTDADARVNFDDEFMALYYSLNGKPAMGMRKVAMDDKKWVF